MIRSPYPEPPATSLRTFSPPRAVLKCPRKGIICTSSRAYPFPFLSDCSPPSTSHCPRFPPFNGISLPKVLAKLLITPPLLFILSGSNAILRDGRSWFFSLNPLTFLFFTTRIDFILLIGRTCALQIGAVCRTIPPALNWVC